MTIYHKHHIIPKHMGGSDDPSNLIKLTVEEHAEAHLDLYKKFGKEQDLIAYKTLSGLITAEEARIQAVKLSNTGRKQTEEHKKKRVASRMKTCPAPTLGKKLPPASEERKRKISEANKGRPNPRKGDIHTDEAKSKMSISAKKRPRLKCLRCGKEMPKQNLVRYHGLKGEKCST